jgi:ribonuclease D
LNTSPPPEPPPSKPVLLRESADLSAVCLRLAQSEFVTVDTEFMRETTYYPKLCLIQIASAAETILIDPLAEGMDLAPFLALMADARVMKVFHAARQDLEIIWQMGQMIPAPLFDTQVAAMVCGYGEQVSYESLASSLAGAKIDKSSRFTDWSRRPLSEAQLLYAAADVTHLRLVYEKLQARLTKTERSSWVADEMAILTNPKTYQIEPEESWQRIKARLKKPIERAVLMALAAWRETEAQSRDVPRGRVMKDEALVEIAMAQPVSPDDLARLRALPNGFERSRAGGEILAAVQRGKACDLSRIPAFEKDRPGGNGALIQLLKVLLQGVAERHNVAAKLLANGDDLETLAADPSGAHGVLQGWRGEIFGTLALQLIRGEVTIGLERGRIVTVKREV